MPEQQLSRNQGLRAPELSSQSDQFLLAATLLMSNAETLSEMTQRICDRHLCRHTA